MEIIYDIARAAGFAVLILGGAFLLFGRTGKDNRFEPRHFIAMNFLFGAFYVATFSPIALKLGKWELSTEAPVVYTIVPDNAELRNRLVDAAGRAQRNPLLDKTIEELR